MAHLTMNTINRWLIWVELWSKDPRTTRMAVQAKRVIIMRTAAEEGNQARNLIPLKLIGTG